MPIVTAGRPGGADQSTVRVADATWETGEAQIRREAEALGGFVLDVLTWEPPLSSQYAPERNCDDLASVLVWLRTLDPTG